MECVWRKREVGVLGEIKGWEIAWNVWYERRIHFQFKKKITHEEKPKELDILRRFNNFRISIFANDTILI